MSKRKSLSLELVSLGRDSYASHSTIGKLLAHVREHGIPDSCDRSAQFRARKEICRKTPTEYGYHVVDITVPLANGGTKTMPFQNPLAFFHYHCQHSPEYARIVARALEKHPCSPAQPWGLVLYQDGVDPSDGLAKNHSRKSCVFYWAFAELGLHALGHEEVWGTLCVCRASEHHQFAGGISALFQVVLELFHGETHDIRRSGVAVTLHAAAGGMHTLIVANARILLADMPALKECTACKGHAGIVCCCLCINAVQHNASHEEAIPLHLLADKAVSISEFDVNAFKPHTKETIQAVIRKINENYDEWKDPANKQMTKVKFDTLCKIRGWNWTPANVILNPRFDLNLATMTMFDWAHVYVHDGLADVEFGMLMKVFYSAKSRACSYQELATYVESFRFPKSAPNLGNLFTDSANVNNAKKGSFTSTGSQFLTIAPVLQRYFEQIVQQRGEFIDNVTSMIAVLDVIALLTALKTGTVSPDDLETAIHKHLTLFKSVYGDLQVRPKHHYATHLSRMLRNFGFLLATFTQERKHRLVTRYCRDRKNLASWDCSAIEEITCHQLWQLGQPFMAAGEVGKPRGLMLVPLREMYPGVPDDKFCSISGLKCNGGSCSPGDVVSFFHDGRLQLGQLLICVGINDQADAVIARWAQAGVVRDTTKWATYTVSGNDVVKVPAASIDTVFIWKLDANQQSCLVYFPFEVRPC